MVNSNLPIHDMAARHSGLTVAVAAAYEEAARVCLDRHHAPPQVCSIEDNGTSIDSKVVWEPSDDQTRGAWANEIDATEAGAYAIALASVELTRQFFAVRRAETGTGADYYIGPDGAGVEDLEDCWRLEVSGTSSNDDRELTRRVLRKIRQARNGDSALPAVAGVVAFPSCRVVIRNVA